MDIHKRIDKYWTDRACSYSMRTRQELQSFKKDAWLELITGSAAGNDALDILDIGTGPGFFPILLSKAGHSVTGIDCAEEMLGHARANAKNEGVAVDFLHMDCHRLSFENDRFDLVMCRNLTWTLEEPEAAYAEWHRVIKPGGKLLIFDANWYLRLFDQDLQRKYEEDMKRAAEMKLANPHAGTDADESAKIARTLPLSSRSRPAWDLDVLKNCGFSNVFSKHDISGSVWDEAEKVFFRSTPMFMVGAEKQQ